MMDDFCVMFERAWREVEPIDWVERMEDFIENLLASDRAALVKEVMELLGEYDGFEIARTREKILALLSTKKED